MSVPASYTLKHPVTVSFSGPQGERQETIVELTLRRVKGKDLRATDDHAGEVAKTLALLAKVTDQPLKVIDELDAEDIAELGGMLEDFLPASLRTGPMSSGT